MKMLMRWVLAAAAAVAAPASAATFDFAGDFGAPVFSYGSFAPDGTFTPFQPSDCGDIGLTQGCFRGSDTYQLVALRSAGSVLIHPGPDFTGNSALVFTAPTTSTYRFAATFDRGDSGDGVGINLVNGAGPVPIFQLNGLAPTFGTTFDLVLTAGQSVGFALDRGPGNYFNDSTFVSGSVTSVPELGTWAMMILGFGLVGLGMRRAIRRSDQRFDARIKRIAAGLEA